MPSAAVLRRDIISKFVEVTGLATSTAQQYLRNNNYNLDAALEQYYSSSQNARVSSKRGGKDSIEAGLDEIFDSFKQSGVEAPKTEEGRKGEIIDSEGIISYGQALGLDMGTYESWILTDLVQVEAMEVTRENFVKGWKRVWEETGGEVPPNLDAQKKYIRSRLDLIKKDADYFKKVYRSTFIALREAGKRELDMGRAASGWATLFEPTLNNWRTANVDFFGNWMEYLTAKFWVADKEAEAAATSQGQDMEQPAGKWTRSVSRDLWNQTFVFAAKTLEDETLSFWSEDQAWPGLIDEFVVWCREKGVLPAAPRGEAMEE
ncbi:hypothetical protein VTK26DRAFT_7630 [Humicola hyalothermophila]